MSSSYLNRATIKKLSLTSLSTVPVTLPIHGLVMIILLCIVFEWGRKAFTFLLAAMESNQETQKKIQDFEPSARRIIDDGSVSREEVEMVFGRLGIFCHSGAAKLQERFDSEDLSGLFGEDEELVAMDDEVKGAFDVFDENGDGFIDERELQRVLCLLGMKEGSEVQRCRDMIRVFDENGDGKIDFHEFSKLI
nr:probable calcium-binding protein CML45 [Ipomoea batatas]